MQLAIVLLHFSDQLKFVKINLHEKLCLAEEFNKNVPVRRAESEADVQDPPLRINIYQRLYNI